MSESVRTNAKIGLRIHNNIEKYKNQSQNMLKISKNPYRYKNEYKKTWESVKTNAKIGLKIHNDIKKYKNQPQNTLEIWIHISIKNERKIPEKTPKSRVSLYSTSSLSGDGGRDGVTVFPWEQSSFVQYSDLSHM